MEERPKNPPSDENRSVNDTQQTTSQQNKETFGFFCLYLCNFSQYVFFEEFENGMRRVQYHKEREKITHEWNQI